MKSYGIDAIVDTYMSCIEELINIPVLTERFKAVESQGNLNKILEEIIRQIKLEFNYSED